MAQKSSTKNSTEEPTFEQALDELEKITHELESGSASLEASITLYERGVALRAICEKKLKAAEGRWLILRKKKNGESSQEEIPTGKIPEPNEFGDGLF